MTSAVSDREFPIRSDERETTLDGVRLFPVAPDICRYEKVHQELDEIFQGEERPITPQDILKMQYLDKVVKETQRVIPVVPVIARTLDQDLEIGGRVIPAGVMVVIHLACLHKDPQQFPEPERFDPDRFLPENIAKRHPYSFVPFSAGPRNCLGKRIPPLLLTSFGKFARRADARGPHFERGWPPRGAKLELFQQSRLFDLSTIPSTKRPECVKPAGSRLIGRVLSGIPLGGSSLFCGRCGAADFHTRSRVAAAENFLRLNGLHAIKHN
ncbi:hypothetical protein GEV33_004571 [Tenebrio molitor]|uniref:Cytochrome P450 monooxygenase n=1 Tax=Tenebrio molitor TaxID=7067 RepID=A0A8J6HQJ5_TENMO|nr:hypothetical protein GEV33_004571 [Tenebrio molitor]